VQLLLLVALAVMTAIGAVVTGVVKSSKIKEGNINKLTNAIDYDGNLCGSGKNVSNKALGYYLLDQSVVCVKKCPSKTDYTSFICHYDLQESVDNDITKAYKYLTQYKCMYAIKTDQCKLLQSYHKPSK
jgi:hypothetical protein